MLAAFSIHNSLFHVHYSPLFPRGFFAGRAFGFAVDAFGAAVFACVVVDDVAFFTSAST